MTVDGPTVDTFGFSVSIMILCLNDLTPFEWLFGLRAFHI